MVHRPKIPFILAVIILNRTPQQEPFSRLSCIIRERELANVEQGDNKFLPFAMRKSGLREHGFYATEKEVEADDIWGIAR